MNSAQFEKITKYLINRTEDMQVEDVQALHEHLNNALKARIEEIKTRNNEAPIYTYRNLRTGNGDDIST